MVENKKEIVKISNETNFLGKLYVLGAEIFVLFAGIWVLYTIHIEGSGFQIGSGYDGIHIPNILMDIIGLAAILGAFHSMFNLFFRKKPAIYFYEDGLDLGEQQYQYQDINKIHYEDNTLSITIADKELEYYLSITYHSSTVYELDKLIEEKLGTKLVPTIKQ